jgi:hypothetical protein
MPLFVRDACLTASLLLFSLPLSLSPPLLLLMCRQCQCKQRTLSCSSTELSFCSSSSLIVSNWQRPQLELRQGQGEYWRAGNRSLVS